MKYIITFSILLSFIISGCKSSYVTLQVLQPSVITIPEDIQKVAIVNRTRPSEENKTRSIVEGVIQGQGIYADRDGAEDCLFGLRDALSHTGRYSAVIQPTGIDLRGTGTGVFPALLPWDQVQKICTDNSADILIVLEVFDSESRIDPSKGPDITTNNREGRPIIVPTFNANLFTRVTSGWRIYDPKYKRIIDEYKTENHTNALAKEAPTPEQAIAKLPLKRDAVKQLGMAEGGRYSTRISPTWINVTRTYYTDDNDEFKKATRMARANDWKGAAEIWKKQTTSADKKIAGRACYNMGVASEVLGNLDAALQWANKSYEEFSNKAALQYTRQLNQRIDDRNRLNQQENTKE